MRILVTGGAGFIGSAFIRYWLKNHPDDSIINFDALKYSGNLENLRGVDRLPNYEFLKSDICDRDEVDKAMEKDIDTVINFAAQTHVDLALYTPYEFIKTNIIGTKNLLDAATKYKIKRFYQISTDEVFGDLPFDSKEKFTESTPPHPNNEYAASKAAAEQFVMAYQHTYNLPTTISNCTNNLGPYQYPEKFVPLAITNVLEGKKIPLYGRGEHVRDWLHVEDHCLAIDLILEKGGVGKRYLIGSDHEEITNLELLKMILKIMGKSEDFIEFVKDRPGHDRKYAVDNSQIKALGWLPKYGLTETVALTVDWYTRNKDWWKKIKSGEYRKNYELIYQSKK